MDGLSAPTAAPQLSALDALVAGVAGANTWALLALLFVLCVIAWRLEPSRTPQIVAVDLNGVHISQDGNCTCFCRA